MFSIAFHFINSFPSCLFGDSYLYFSGWFPTNYLCFLNRTKYLLKNSVQNSRAWEVRDYELISSALQVRFCGSDILSVKPVFLLTLGQKFSVWWSSLGIDSSLILCLVLQPP